MSTKWWRATLIVATVEFAATVANPSLAWTATFVSLPPVLAGAATVAGIVPGMYMLSALVDISRWVFRKVAGSAPSDIPVH